MKIKVENGIVKLEDEVDWDFQRTSAITAIEDLEGVKSIINSITVKPKHLALDIWQKINGAFVRSATLDAVQLLFQRYK